MMRYASLLVLVLILCSCGGGGGTFPAGVNYYIDPAATNATGKDLSPYSAKPLDPKTFNIIGGVAPFTVSASVVRGTKGALPTIVMGADGRSFTATPAQVDRETVISITASGADGQSTSSVLTVEVPTLNVTAGGGGTSVTIPQDGSVPAQFFITGGTPGISAGAFFYSIDASACSNMVEVTYDTTADPFSFTVAGANNGTGSCTITITDSTQPVVQTASVEVKVQ